MFIFRARSCDAERVEDRSQILVSRPAVIHPASRVAGRAHDPHTSSTGPSIYASREPENSNAAVHGIENYRFSPGMSAFAPIANFDRKCLCSKHFRLACLPRQSECGVRKTLWPTTLPPFLINRRCNCASWERVAAEPSDATSEPAAFLFRCPPKRSPCGSRSRKPLPKPSPCWTHNFPGCGVPKSGTQTVCSGYGQTDARLALATTRPPAIPTAGGPPPSKMIRPRSGNASSLVPTSSVSTS
jgi:hypothetical protein